MSTKRMVAAICTVLGSVILPATATEHEALLRQMAQQISDYNYPLEHGLFGQKIDEQFERSGIETVSDIIESDPRILGRILGIHARNAQLLQEELQRRLR